MFRPNFDRYNNQYVYSDIYLSIYPIVSKPSELPPFVEITQKYVKTYIIILLFLISVLLLVPGQTLSNRIPRH